MKDDCSAQKVDVDHICYDCNKRNYWGGNCRDINIKRDFDWCKAKCQREKECLYWKMIAENGEEVRE
jgi:hypothetical protein